MGRLVLQNNAPGGISFSSIASPRMDDGGRVFFSATLPGQQGFNIYRIDPGSTEPVLLVDGNTGLFRIMTPVAVNGVGSMVFLAERGVGGPRGIYTGPKSANDKVIAVDDELDGEKVIALELNSRAINNNGPSRRGQIVFAAQLSSDSGYSISRADPVNQPPAAQDGSIRVRAGTSVSGTHYHGTLRQPDAREPTGRRRSARAGRGVHASAVSRLSERRNDEQRRERRSPSIRQVFVKNAVDQPGDDDAYRVSESAANSQRSVRPAASATTPAPRAGRRTAPS